MKLSCFPRQRVIYRPRLESAARPQPPFLLPKVENGTKSKWKVSGKIAFFKVIFWRISVSTSSTNPTGSAGGSICKLATNS